MAYKKHLFPFEEHQRTNNDKDGDTSADNNNNGIPSPTIKTQDQQSGDEDCGSMTSTKSSNVDQEVDQGNGPPASHDDDSNSNTTQDVTDMDTTDNVNDRYDHDDNVKYLYHYILRGIFMWFVLLPCIWN